ncbi:MAG: hypothetical protein SYR96_05360 [Actinomycetota bacterium]|nr:hypothetical protein [Actinomycetota bacterium]
MMRREVLTRLREGGGLYGRGQDGNRFPDMHIELDPSDHEEPTWEVRRAGEGRKRRLDRRTRMILGIAALAAVVVNAGAAWSYWQITGSEVAVADGPPIELSLRARSDLNRPLDPGRTGDLIVTVTNDSDFPIRISSVTGDGPVVADPEHGEVICRPTGVELTRPRFDVQWEVGRNTIGAFNVPGGLSMRADAKKTCVGATFTVPVRVTGVRKQGS